MDISSKVVRSASSLEYAPIEHENWWRETVRYSKFNRQGLDIVCASFEHREPIGCIVFVTGWSESFLKYADLIRTLYMHNYSVYTYDHQSQGLSGRWLQETQYTWIHTFDDYVDDFVFFLTTVARQNTSRPIYVVAHSMGCLISAIGMSRHPSIVSRAVFSAPLIRNKCGMKYFEYKNPLPQPLVYWITYVACYCGLGSMPAMGFFKERAEDKIKLKLTTDKKMMQNWEALRKRYPSIMSTCVTNDWILHCIRAQNKFARIYELFRTNTIILQATDDIFVYNRAMSVFSQTAPATRIFTVPNSYHEVLLEAPEKRNACARVILNFFEQESDDVHRISPIPPLITCDPSKHIFSYAEIVLRATGVTVAAVGFVLGVTLMVGGGRGARR
eukprot:CAMPEP_0185035568 /NCGR_PEP_ID=MMETSP1103-20130426/27186_1 /TAXON_ID=36769 /ORGANISM="Paraphysomonas bandaiensis, Strain Caron Lab Isolate" /LENGTH=386 /DNA_ID=CAMNT_0027572707 /DNA_START=59 /DNA_END=1219 /DNA_ORIENTATION=-